MCVSEDTDKSSPGAPNHFNTPLKRVQEWAHSLVLPQQQNKKHMLTLSDRAGVAPCSGCSAVLRGTVRAIERAFILSYHTLTQSSYLLRLSSLTMCVKLTLPDEDLSLSASLDSALSLLYTTRESASPTIEKRGQSSN